LLTVRAVVALAVCGFTVALGAQPSLAGELAFEDTRCEQGPCEMSIWRASDDGLFAQRLTAMEFQHYGGRDTAPSWSPDGDRAVFERSFYGGGDGPRGGLFIADAAGRERVRQLTDELSDAFPDWSPRGDTVVFESRRERAGGLPDHPSSVIAPDSDIFLVNTDGSDARRIVNGSGQDMKPRFSQDGRMSRSSWNFDGDLELTITP
jgi:dipeptidyl aminopeptidase/acylaminoacyl peptidase